MAKTFSVSVLFKAVDNATKPIKGMARVMSQLKTPINRIKGIFGDMGKKVGESLAGIAKIIKKVALGIAAMATITFAALLKFTSMADRIGKVADKLGLSTDQLQAWRFAAEQSGLEAEAFDNALRFMNKGLGEAKTGTGLAFEALKQLRIGLNNADRSAKSNAQLFSEMADKISRVADPMEKAALASKLWGRSGTDLLNMLKGGAEGLDEFRKELIREGGMIPEDVIRNSEKLTDSINRIKKTIVGLLSTAFAPLIIQLDNTIGRMQKWLRENKTLITIKIREYVDNIIEGVKNLVPKLKTLLIAIRDFVVWLKDLNPRMKLFIATLLGLVTIVAPVVTAMLAIAATICTVITILSPAILAMLAFTATIYPFILAAGILALAAFIIIKNWKPIKTFFSGLFTGMKENLLDIVSFWRLRTIKLVDFLLIKWQRIAEFFTGLFTGIKENFLSIVTFIKTQIDRIVGLIPDFVNKKMGIKIEPEMPRNRLIVGPNGKLSEKSETDINIKVTADNGSSAVIEGVKRKKGSAKVNVASAGYLGLNHQMAGM